MFSIFEELIQQILYSLKDKHSDTRELHIFHDYSEHGCSIELHSSPKKYTSISNRLTQKYADYNRITWNIIAKKSVTMTYLYSS
jgi:hypothetical protein